MCVEMIAHKNKNFSLKPLIIFTLFYFIICYYFYFFIFALIYKLHEIRRHQLRKINDICDGLD